MKRGLILLLFFSLVLLSGFDAEQGSFIWSSFALHEIVVFFFSIFIFSFFVEIFLGRRTIPLLLYLFKDNECNICSLYYLCGRDFYFSSNLTCKGNHSEVVHKLMQRVHNATVAVLPSGCIRALLLYRFI